MYRPRLHPAEAPRLYALYGPLAAVPAVAAAGAAASSAAAATSTLATIATVASLASSVVGVGMSVFGSIRGAQAQRAQSAYQSQILKNNQRTAEWQAKDATDRGKIAENVQRQRTKQLIGTQRASLAANGVQVDTGSASDITADTAELGELDALTIRSNAEREAFSRRMEAYGMAGQAGLAQYQGRSASAGPGIFQAVGNLAPIADKWYNLGEEKGWWGE